jgi:hypothetical protein
MEMILSRYSNEPKVVNSFLSKPITDIKYKNTMIFNGRNMDSTEFNK